MLDLALSTHDDVIARLYGYWQEKRGDRRFPARRDLDPLEFGYALGWVMLVDVTHDPLRFRIRLYGSDLVAFTGSDMTGVYIDEHPLPEFQSHAEAEWREVVERGEATHGVVQRVFDGRTFRAETLRLPLSADGATIDMLLIAVRPR